MSNTLTVSFEGKAAQEKGVALLLEQAKFGDFTGKVSKGAVVQYMRSLIYGEDRPSMDCGLNEDGDSFSCMVNAYPVSPVFAYNLHVAYGEVSEMVVVEYDFTETVNVKLESELKLSYPAQEIISAEFIGSGYDQAGTVTVLPALNVGSDSVTVSKPIYGAVSVVYKILVHSYAVTVKRQPGNETAFPAVVYANYNGGVTWLEIEPPTGSEENFVSCGFGYSGTVTGEGDETGLPIANPVHRTIKVNYCTQEIISDSSV